MACSGVSWLRLTQPEREEAGVSRKPEHLLGMDIGGTKAVVVLAGRDADALEETRLDDWTTGSAERDLEQLVGAARELLDRASLRPEDVAALGVSVPGPLDPDTGVVVDTPNLHGWSHFPLRARLEAALGTRVRIENDANAAALAEWRYGAGRGTQSLLFLTMSTGVGGGLILDGRLYRGRHFQAGEVGHLEIEPGGRLCGCGLRGCLEAYTSGANLAARIREDIASGERTAILELAGGDAKRVSAELWARAIRAGDAYALRLREEFLERLSHGLGMLVMVLDPERVVLGTIVRENPDLFLDELCERTRGRVWRELRDVEIVVGELGPRLPAYAALSVALLALEA